MSIKDGWHYCDEKDEYYLNENGQRIPHYACLCDAHYATECVCDCTSWSDNDYDEWDEFYDVNDYD